MLIGQTSYTNISYIVIIAHQTLCLFLFFVFCFSFHVDVNFFAWQKFALKEQFSKERIIVSCCRNISYVLLYFFYTISLQSMNIYMKNHEKSYETS